MPDMRIVVDTRALEELERKLQEAVQEEALKALQQELLYELGERLVAATKEKTPVATGHLRGNWYAGNVQWKNAVAELEVYNPVEYAAPVEYGHAQEVGRYVPAIGKRLVAPMVPGFFMLHRSEKELEAILPDFLKVRIERYIEEALNR